MSEAKVTPVKTVQAVSRQPYVLGLQGFACRSGPEISGIIMDEIGTCQILVLFTKTAFSVIHMDNGIRDQVIEKEQQWLGSGCKYILIMHDAAERKSTILEKYPILKRMHGTVQNLPAEDNAVLISPNGSTTPKVISFHTRIFSSPERENYRLSSHPYANLIYATHLFNAIASEKQAIVKVAKQLEAKNKSRERQIKFFVSQNEADEREVFRLLFAAQRDFYPISSRLMFDGEKFCDLHSLSLTPYAGALLENMTRNLKLSLIKFGHDKIESIDQINILFSNFLDLFQKELPAILQDEKQQIRNYSEMWSIAYAHLVGQAPRLLLRQDCAREFNQMQRYAGTAEVPAHLLPKFDAKVMEAQKKSKHGSLSEIILTLLSMAAIYYLTDRESSSSKNLTIGAGILFVAAVIYQKLNTKGGPTISLHRIPELRHSASDNGLGL